MVVAVDIFFAEEVGVVCTGYLCVDGEFVLFLLRAQFGCVSL